MNCLFAITLLLSAAYANSHTTVFKRETDNLKQVNFKHMIAVSSFKCRTPQPRLVPIEDFHMKDPQLLYTPHATVLHRCGQDTGCCTNSESSCQPSHQQEVHLVFNVYDTMSETHDTVTLQAYNHTLCHCGNFRVLPG